MINSVIRDESLPKMLRRVASEYADNAVQYYKNEKGVFEKVLYKDFYEIVLNLAGGLLSIGCKREDKIGMLADDRKEWQQISFAVLTIGAADVPRSSDTSPAEIEYILSFSDCTATVVENSRILAKVCDLKGNLPVLKTIIILERASKDDRSLAAKSGVELIDFPELEAKGIEFRKQNPGVVEAELEKGQMTDLATLIYTSGTTGVPKGVMLTHENFMSQFDEITERIIIYPGEKAICVLPVWHSFQRYCEFYVLYRGAALCYSKPIGSILLADVKTLNPAVMPSVPRIWEALYEGIFKAMRKTGGVVYALFFIFVGIGILQTRFLRILKGQNARYRRRNVILDFLISFIPLIVLTPLKSLGNQIIYKKIREKFGKGFRLGVSGGGALPPYIDEFFWAIGVTVLEGYGLTETAPVVAVRPYHNPVFGTIGSCIRGMEVKIVDDDGNKVPVGKKGLLLVRGRQVMKGYYKQKELTDKVISPDGWFDTGDLAIMTYTGDLKICGRKKDTIVLRGGENVEPAPLEMALTQSRYIAAAVVVGQDQRTLGALILPAKEELKAYAKENGIQFETLSDLFKDPDIKKLYETEISDRINAKNGFKNFEHIGKFAFIEKEFEVGVELSAKQELMRYKVVEQYEKIINTLF